MLWTTKPPSYTAWPDFDLFIFKVFVMKRLIRFVALGLASTTLLLGCGGSGKVYQPLRPTALYTFGDGIVDDGQTGGGKLYTVNPSNPATTTVYSLPHTVASGYGLTIKPQSAGGTAWGQGGSQIADLRTQINAQAAVAGFSGYSRSDLIMLSAGMEDLITQTQAVLTSANSQATAQANVRAAVANYGQAMLQLNGQGARYIYILPPYDLSQSPWMATLKVTYSNAPAVYADLYKTFRSALDAEAERVNGSTQSLYRSPGFATRMGYYTDPGNNQNNAGTSITNAALCAGAGATDASQCTDATLVTADPAQIAKYLFADNRHPVPGALNLLGNNAVSELKGRWGSP
jgi:hypothetical protein